MLVDLKKWMFLQAAFKYAQIILHNRRPIQLSQRLTSLATQQLNGKDTTKSTWLYVYRCNTQRSTSACCRRPSRFRCF